MVTKTNLAAGLALAATAAISIRATGQQGTEQNLARGQMKALQCVACHGPIGVSSNPMFPHIAGQNASYLEIQLENFRTGERYHPLMTPVAESLSRQDVVDLAAYFSRIGGEGPLAAAAQSEPTQ